MGFTFVRHGTNIDFIGVRYWAYAISLIVILAGLVSAIWINGYKLGIDFAGGVIVQVQFLNPVNDEALKKSLDIPPSASATKAGIICCAFQNPKPPMPPSCGQRLSRPCKRPFPTIRPKFSAWKLSAPRLARI